MTRAATRPKMSAEAYLVWEREQERKHELHDGEVFAMAGGSPRHNALCAAVARDLGAEVRGGECRVLSSDQRVSLKFQGTYVYPDATVVCGRLELEEGTRDVVSNPGAVIEVLSASTEADDRGAKWDGYRRVGSLEDYLLISQREAKIEHFRRQQDGSWRYAVAGPGEGVTLTLGASLHVDSLFEGVFELPGDEELDDEERGT